MDARFAIDTGRVAADDSGRRARDAAAVAFTLPRITITGERRVGGVAVALVAVHLVADMFVSPEPGVGWRGHVVPGVAAAAALGVAFLVVCRGRAGIAAAAMIVLGTWSVVGAGIAATNAADGRLEIDDVSGLSLGIVGVMLIGVAAHVLWRTRRRDGRWLLRRVARVALAIVVAVWLVVPVAIAIVATHRPRGPVESVALGRPAHDVTLHTADGLSLRAAYVPSRNGAAVVLLPELSGTAEHARLLVRHGYGVLAVDMRGYGQSDGDPNAFGWAATGDVDAAIAYLSSRPEVRREAIAGLGLSVGGEVLLDAAAENAALRAVVSDGAGERSIRESLTRGIAAALVLPLQAVETAAVVALTGDLPPPGLQDVLPRIAPRSVLLVFAGRGGGGEDLNRTFASRAGEGMELWEIPEAKHVEGIRVRPAAYERRIVSFLDRALGVESASAPEAATAPHP